MITLNSLIAAKKKLPDPKYSKVKFVNVAIDGGSPIYHKDEQLNQYPEIDTITFRLDIFKNSNGIVRLWVYDGLIIITDNN